MRDTRDVCAKAVGPVYLQVEGTTLAVGWPLIDGQFGPLSVRYADGEVRCCTVDEQQRFQSGLSYYYFVQRGRWAQAYGKAGTPLSTTHPGRDDGGGALV